MITLLSAPLPQAYSLFSPSLPEVAALALELLITTVLALTWARTHLAHCLKHIQVATENSALAPKPQSLTLTSNVNPMAETPAYRLAMAFTHRHAASPSLTLDLNQSRTSRPWVGRSSRKGSWFTLATSVLALNTQDLTLVGRVIP
jgi:hypothetical protein